MVEGMVDGLREDVVEEPLEGAATAGEEEEEAEVGEGESEEEEKREVEQVLLTQRQKEGAFVGKKKDRLFREDG